MQTESAAPPSPSIEPPSAVNLSPPEPSALSATAKILRQYWLRLSAVSAVLLLPCFWHRTIQAGDLASHLYNAWLAQLIERGQVPGLWIASQWNNILFDEALLHLGNVLGLRVAEKLVVSAAVLIFFWGAFALVCAMSNRFAWQVLPGLAAVAYGWTFSSGFFNYYLSIGLAFWALALLHSGRGHERWLVLLLLPWIVLAHPLGLALLGAAGGYIVLARKFDWRAQIALFVTGLAILGAARLYFTAYYRFLSVPYKFAAYLFHFTGADQLMLYGARYRVVSNLLLALIVLAVLVDFVGKRAADRSAYILPLQLYGLAMAAGFLLPWVVFPPQYQAPAGRLTERLTSVTAVLAFCLLAAARPRKWHFAGLSVVAVVFFSLLYVDTGKFDKMELQAERYERLVPRGSRIIATIWPVPGSSIVTEHLVDRACIGYCFSYADYEPSTGQFRVRASPGNPYVVSDWRISDAILGGQYIVQPRDLPIFEIYQCDPTLTQLCMRELVAGERNGRIGVPPPFAVRRR